MSTYKRINLCLCLAGLGLVSIPAGVRANGGPMNVDVGFHANFVHGGYNMTLGPWYAYFPYEAHFQMPAPVGLYPNWPVPYLQAPAPVAPPPRIAPGPGALPPAVRQAPIQPVNYYYGYQQAPSYWYAR